MTASSIARDLLFFVEDAKMPPYCGAKTSSRPDGTPEDCRRSRQLRLFGRRMLPVSGAPGGAALVGASTRNVYCGGKAPVNNKSPGHMVDCKTQWRMWGLLPIISSPNSVVPVPCFRVGRARGGVPHVSFDREGRAKHIYDATERRDGAHPFLFVSFVSTGLDEATRTAAVMRPGESPGAIGYAFGYFSPKTSRNQAAFYIARIFVNSAYRRGREHSSVPVWLLSSFGDAIVQAAREQFPTTRSVYIAPDQDAPCARMFHKQGLKVPPDPGYLTEQQSESVKSMYEGGGFTITGTRGGNGQSSFLVRSWG